MGERLNSIDLLKQLDSLDQIRLGYTAARLAYPFWQRAFPEAEIQYRIHASLILVEKFCQCQLLQPNAKQIAIDAFKFVKFCDLPPGDIYRHAGFSIAHLAMVPWFYENKNFDKVEHSTMVSINYCQGLYSWAKRDEEFKNTMYARFSELKLA